jgi:hypothetical protein
VEPSMSVKRSVSVSIAKAYEGIHLRALPIELPQI